MIQENPEENNKMIRQPEEGVLKMIMGSQCNWVKPQEGKIGRRNGHSPGGEEDRSFSGGSGEKA